VKALDDEGEISVKQKEEQRRRVVPIVRDLKSFSDMVTSDSTR